MHALMLYQAAFKRLREEPALLPKAVDEGIRWASPVRHFFRTATRACQFRGREIRKGDSLMLSYPSANRDEEVFERPFDFIVDRSPNPHIAFGYGPHLCLGPAPRQARDAAPLRDIVAMPQDDRALPATPVARDQLRRRDQVFACALRTYSESINPQDRRRPRLRAYRTFEICRAKETCGKCHVWRQPDPNRRSMRIAYIVRGCRHN